MFRQPAVGAPFAIRKFEVEQFNPNKYSGTVHELTGMFEEKKFFELEGILTNKINGWTVLFCDRKDDPEIILCSDGSISKPKYHQIKAEYYPNDMELMAFCQRNGYQKYIAGHLECRVCLDFGAEKIDKATGKVMSSVLEGLAHRKTSEIVKLKILGLNPFDDKKCAAPFLSQLAMGYIEKMNNSCGEDREPKVKIHFEEKMKISRMLTENGWQTVNQTTVQPSALCGILLGHEIDGYARRNRNVLEQYFDGKNFPRPDSAATAPSCSRNA